MYHQNSVIYPIRCIPVSVIYVCRWKESTRSPLRKCYSNNIVSTSYWLRTSCPVNC